MYYVPQARNYVPITLDIMYFHHKFDKKMDQPQRLKIRLKPCIFSMTQPERDQL